MRSPVRVAISLGSNLGNRREHLEHAVHALSRDLTDSSISAVIDTEPVEVGPGQPTYLNAVVVGNTNLSPRALLNRLMEIEREQGRERPFPMSARTLDLDLILYGEEVIQEEGLTVPHPRFSGREFVLAPLASIAPDMIDPISGFTVRELLDQLRGSG